MATVTHYIRSEYDPELDKDRLLKETGQQTEDDIDPWQTESSTAGFHSSRRLANAPKFVPALLSYDEWGTTSATSLLAEPTSDLPHGDVASWYRSLSRQDAGPKQQEQQHQPQQLQVASPNDATRHRGPEATLEPLASSSLSPSITHPASSSNPTNHLTNTTSLSSSARPTPPSRRQHRASRDWFISRALSHSQSTSAPPMPGPSTSDSSSSLADILSRHPPSAQPLRPPVFLHLGPSNKGWTMLQNQGWSEGEGLGANTSTSLGDGNDPPTKTKGEKTRKRMRFDRPSKPIREQTKEEREKEVLVLVDDDEDEDDDDDDDASIIEVRRKKVGVPIIDLTQSDTEEDEDKEDDSEDDNNDDDTPAPAPASSSSPTGSATTPTTGIIATTDPDPRATQTALLTPLPTILKSDRLGIGLKAKTEGPYRSSVKRVTHNAAALAAHIKASEDLRRTQRQLGRGRRSFARAERIEREKRQGMMAYLSEP